MTTWNPSDKGPNITLLNSNLTARLPISGSPAEESVRSTTSKTSGKWYFEVTANWIDDGDRMPGIMTATGNISNFPGSDTQGWSIYYDNGSTNWFIYNNNSPAGIGSGGIANGGYIGVCLDLNSNFLYYIKNGSNFVGNPAAGTGGQAIAAGTWYAAIGGWNDTATNMDVITNFGATAFAFGPPTGFTAWDTTFTYKSFDVSNISITRVSQPVGS